MSSYSTMTDNPLVEAVAKAMAPSNWKPFDPKIHGSPVNQKAAKVMWLSQATAALRAIEDAGYRIEKADPAMQSMQSPYASPDLANAPIADRKS